jgi:hypothetical protein
MLLGGHSWRLYFYVILAFSIALFVLAFFVVEETSYDRRAPVLTESSFEVGANQKTTSASILQETETVVATPDYYPPRRTFAQTLSVQGKYDGSVSFFGIILRSFTYFLVPQVLWVITTYGIIIGLGAFVIGFTFPILIVQPPYNWEIVSPLFPGHCFPGSRPC